MAPQARDLGTDRSPRIREVSYHSATGGSVRAGMQHMHATRIRRRSLATAAIMTSASRIVPGFFVSVGALCLSALPLGAVHAQTDAADAAPGIPTLAPIGEQQSGLWLTSYRPGDAPFFDIESVVFKPWAQGLYDTRQEHDLEPHARCKASGAIRQFLTPYGVEIVEIEALKRLYLFDIGGPHTYREVYMDGRGHPADLVPTNYGHNIGWWDGDTLVIDSTGYNEDFWFERAGLPHTEAAHVREYFRRTDAGRVHLRADRRHGLRDARRGPADALLAGRTGAVRVHLPAK